MIVTFATAILVCFFIFKDRLLNNVIDINESPIKIQGGNYLKIGDGNIIDSSRIRNRGSKEGVNQVNVGDDNEINGLEINQEN